MAFTVLSEGNVLVLAPVDVQDNGASSLKALMELLVTAVPSLNGVGPEFKEESSFFSSSYWKLLF